MLCPRRLHAAVPLPRPETPHFTAAAEEVDMGRVRRSTEARASACLPTQRSSRLPQALRCRDCRRHPGPLGVVLRGGVSVLRYSTYVFASPSRDPESSSPAPSLVGRGEAVLSKRPLFTMVLGSNPSDPAAGHIRPAVSAQACDERDPCGQGFPESFLKTSGVPTRSSSGRFGR